MNHRLRPAFLFAIAATFLYLSLFVLPATPVLFPFDQFISFDNARRMAAGQRLYGEIFQYTLPGAELLELALVKMFGAKVAVLNGMMFAAGLIDVILAWVLASTILGEWDAILASLFFLYFGIHGALDATHHTLSVMASYAATAVIVRKRNAWRLVASGTMLGLATCFTQTCALVTAGVAAFLVWDAGQKPEAERRLLKQLLCLSIPFVFLSAAGCTYAILEGGWQVFLRDVVEFPLLHYPYGWGNAWSTALFDVPLWPIAVFEWAMVKGLVPAVYLIFFVIYRREVDGNDRPPPESMLLAFVGLALFATVAFAPAFIRMAEVWAPAIVLAIWMLRRLTSVRWRYPAWAGVGALMLIATLRTQLRNYQYFEGPAGTIAISSPDEFAELTWLANHTDRGDAFFAAWTPMFYVLLDLRNVAAVPFVEADRYTRADQATAVAQRLRDEQPKFIFWPFTQSDADKPGDVLYPVAIELHANYRSVASFPDGEIWQRTGLERAIDSKSKIGKLAD